MTENHESTLTGEPAGREVVKNQHGQVVAEIVLDGDQYRVVGKAKPTFPPSQRSTLIGTFGTLEEARNCAMALL